MDWKKLLGDLMAAGMTQAEIGAAIGVTQGMVSHVFNGRHPGFRYEPGAKLVALHRRVAGRQRKTEKAFA